MKTLIVALTGAFLVLAPVSASAQVKGSTCYKLNENYRVKQIKCGSDKWPYTEFNGNSSKSLAQLFASIRDGVTLPFSRLREIFGK